MAVDKGTEREDVLKELNDKMDLVVKVLQDYGLNFIQKIGELKHTLSILTEKVENLEKTMVYIKGLGVKIDEISRMKEYFKEEFNEIKSLIKARSQNGALYEEHSSENKIIESIDEETLPDVILERFMNGLEGYTLINEVVSTLENAKEEIFKITGGHRVLYEINNFLKDLKKKDVVNDELNEALKKEIKEKTRMWINKLKS
ncbi:MAG: hypothetical protein ACTSU2_04270 [Promethearchaeota archaeon]